MNIMHALLFAALLFCGHALVQYLERVAPDRPVEPVKVVKRVMA